jgi:hypothetical protein
MFGVDGFMLAVLVLAGVAVVFVSTGVKAVPQGMEYTAATCAPCGPACKSSRRSSSGSAPG